MPITVCISEYVSYKTVTYYTVKNEDSGETSMDDFLNRMSKELSLKDEFERFMYLLESLGNRNMGIKYDELRYERESALPPLRAKGIEIRLYCYYVNERIIILFNGGCKTTRKAEDCPNVSRYFHQAQSWSKQLEGMIEHNGEKITNLEELYFNF